MKIVFTTHSYYPTQNGVQYVTEYLAEGLAHRGHEVAVLTAEESERGDEVHNGVRIMRINIPVWHTIYMGDKKAYKKLILSATQDADVMINVCMQCPTTDLIMPYLYEIDCRKILCMHGMAAIHFTKNDMRSLGAFFHKVWTIIRWSPFYHSVSKQIGLYDTVTHLHQEDIANRYFRKHYGVAGEVLENAVDNRFFSDGTAKKELDCPYMIYVANYFPLKNQEYVLNAFYASKETKDFSLIFIGSKRTEYYEALVQKNISLSEAYGRRDIKFLAGVSREETISLVRGAFMFLMGSDVEMYPVVIAEAMAAGVPFICTDVGCVKYLPGGVVVHSIGEMAKCISELIYNDEERMRLGYEGYRYAVEHNKIEKKVDQMEELIYRVCNK